MEEQGEDSSGKVQPDEAAAQRVGKHHGEQGRDVTRKMDEAAGETMRI